MNQRSSIVGKLTFLSKPNMTGWCFGEIELENGLVMSVAGTALAGLQQHQEYEFRGALGSYQGVKQIKVDAAIPHVAANAAGITKYLMSNFNNLGQKTARDFVNLWEAHGKTLEELRQLAIYEPFEIEDWATQNGFGRTIRFKTSSKSTGHPDVEHLHRWLILQHRVNSEEKVMVADATLRKVARFLLRIPADSPIKGEAPLVTVGAALDSFKNNPYKPIFEVEGYGFKAADKIWKEMKMPLRHKTRLGALGWFVLQDACEGGGHSYLPESAFARALHRYDSELVLDEVLSAMREHKVPFIEEEGGFYTESLFRDETTVSGQLQEWLEPTSPIIDKDKKIILNDMHQIEAKMGFNLDEQQKAALLGIASSEKHVHTITAMPGCGKTAIMEFLAQMIKNDGHKQIAFMAPTGKAAKVLSKRVSKFGFDASTIHSAIGFGAQAPQEIIADIVVADEASMIDLPLMSGMITAMKPNAHLILIGDAEQLPSVGPGNVLNDILDLPFDHHRLSQVHRNTGNILNLVKTIKSGEYKQFNPKEGGHNDVSTFGLPPVDKIPKVLDKYLEEVESREDGFQKVCLLTGKRQGDRSTPGWNVTYLNYALQERVNPEGRSIPGCSFKIKDRVIVRKNQRFTLNGENGEYQEFVANGDTGKLVEVVYDDARTKIEHVAIDFDDGRKLKLPSDILPTMDLAYALTVHSAQGSEFDCAMVALTNGAPGLFNRKLFYTGVSRAKEKLYLFGDGITLSNLVTRSGDNRFSRLVGRTLGVIEKDVVFNDIQNSNEIKGMTGRPKFS